MTQPITPNQNVTGIKSNDEDAPAAWEPPVRLAMKSFDRLVNLTVLSELDDPPGSPSDGDTHRIGTGTGDWLNKDGDFAMWDGEGEAWVFFPGDEGTLYYDQGADDWIGIGASGNISIPFKNEAAFVALATSSSTGYDRGDFEDAVDTVNGMLANLRTQGSLAT